MNGCRGALSRWGKIVCSLAAAIVSGALGDSRAHAVLIADARADYQATASLGTTADFGSGAGLPDTGKAGHWNYGQAPSLGGVFTSLIFDTSPPNSAGNPAYRSPDHKFANFVYVPAVSNAKLFGDGSDPAANQLTWHPDSAPISDIRWTAAASEAGSIRITGSFDRTNEPTQGAANFYIYVNGVEKFSVLGVKYDPVNPADAIKSFDVTTTIGSGQNVDFYLVGGGGGVESKLNAQITGAPEPTGLILLGAVAGCAALRRRKVGPTI